MAVYSEVFCPANLASLGRQRCNVKWRFTRLQVRTVGNRPMRRYKSAMLVNLKSATLQSPLMKTINVNRHCFLSSSLLYNSS